MTILRTKKTGECPTCGGELSLWRQEQHYERRFQRTTLGVVLAFALGILSYEAFFDYQRCAPTSPCMRVRNCFVQPVKEP